jgi:hypothetical protein
MLGLGRLWRALDMHDGFVRVVGPTCRHQPFERGANGSTRHAIRSKSDSRDGSLEDQPSPPTQVFISSIYMEMD